MYTTAQLAEPDHPDRLFAVVLYVPPSLHFRTLAVFTPLVLTCDCLPACLPACPPARLPACPHKRKTTNKHAQVHGRGHGRDGVHGSRVQHERPRVRVPAVPGRHGGGGGRVRRGRGARRRHGINCLLEFQSRAPKGVRLLLFFFR